MLIWISGYSSLITAGFQLHSVGSLPVSLCARLCMCCSACLTALIQLEKPDFLPLNCLPIPVLNVASVTACSFTATSGYGIILSLSLNCWIDFEKVIEREYWQLCLFMTL